MLDRPKRLAWISIPFALALSGFVWAQHLEWTYSAPILLRALNLFFLSLTSGAVAALLARGFLTHPVPDVLLIGCGALVWAFVGAWATLTARADVNTQVTIYNLGVFTGAAFQLTGVFLRRQREQALNKPLWWLLLAYGSAAAAVTAMAVFVLRGWAPTFIDPELGPTPLRQLVLGCTISALIVTASDLLSRRSPSQFARWYALGLSLFAIGLLGVMLQPAFDSPLSWIGRATQWLGGIYMLLAAFTCVDESRRWNISLETALAAAQNKTESLLNAMSEGFIGLDPQLRIVYVNPAAAEILNQPAGALINRSFPEAYPGLSGGFGSQLQAALARGNSVQAEEFFASPANRWLDWRAYPSREGLSVLVRDITERRTARDRLKEHTQELEKAVISRTANLSEILAELDHFSYAVAHDMRTPLRTMRGYADVLLDQPASLSKNQLHYLQRIRDAATRMDELLKVSLIYSKLVQENFPLSRVDLQQLLSGIVSSYPNLNSETVEIQIEGTLPFVEGNEGALTQAFASLLAHTVNLTLPGTKGKLRVYGESRGAAVRIWLEHEGKSVSTPDATRAFELFDAAGLAPDGSMGLAIAKKVIQRVGGSIGVEAKACGGARFWVELKIAEAA